MTKDQSLKLQNFAYHLGLAHKNLDELIKSLPVIEEKATKGKKEAPKDEMEEVESKFKETKETKATKGKKAKVEEVEEEETSSDEDEFDFDDAEIEEEEVSEPEFTEADARTAMTTYAKKHSKEKALAILGKFAKTKKIADVPAVKLGALIAALKVGK